jgi:hypothetical protein
MEMRQLDSKTYLMALVGSLEIALPAGVMAAIIRLFNPLLSAH